MKKLMAISPIDWDLKKKVLLFARVAATYGCGELYTHTTGKETTVNCPRSCSSCKLPQITIAYNQHLNQLSRNEVLGYLRYLRNLAVRQCNSNT